MLINTEGNCQSIELHELVVEKPQTRLECADKPAANAPRFDPSKSAERSVRRERRSRHATGFAASGWRVSLW